MRSFVAIFPPTDAHPAVARVLQATRNSIGERVVRWVRPENVHLTLKFLGDIQREDLGNLCAALEKACAIHTPFDASLAGLGAFPSERHARILWAGIGAGSEQLSSLAADLDSVLTPLGFEREERTYTPHLTLGRIRGRPANLDLPQIVLDLGFPVRRVDLVESMLTPKGSIYRIVRAFTLKGSS
ncbi:MAG TPA: RNA 2',3'-cyclic phosphodiesterase [Rubrobacteraceae bacterium]|nr:RNA 2',3'-cyclic phosphodiesterase [Rubrobacteraceae bacterium]